MRFLVILLLSLLIIPASHAQQNDDCLDDLTDWLARIDDAEDDAPLLRWSIYISQAVDWHRDGVPGCDADQREAVLLYHAALVDHVTEEVVTEAYGDDVMGDRYRDILADAVGDRRERLDALIE